jgi:integrase/recombinase XerD
MLDPSSAVAAPPQKVSNSVGDKIFLATLADSSQISLTEWMTQYFHLHVIGAPPKTVNAKEKDLQRFLIFFKNEVGHDHVDNWTPVVTKQFQKSLVTTISPITQKPLKETTINRVLATVRHFGKWLHKQRPLLAGNPLEGVRDIQVDEPDWNGLTSRQLMRLKAACEQRVNACQRGDQNPLLETAVFYTLLQTGLRESELVSLNVYQYHHRGLHDVMRHKSKRVSKKVPLPQEARDLLDRYLKTRNAQPDDPLFVSRYGNRLATKDVYRLCQRLVQQASTYLSAEEKFRFTPHMLRHTFLKRVADKHGIHFAQRMSGNVSIKEVFRYIKPSQQEIDQTVEELF